MAAQGPGYGCAVGREGDSAGHGRARELLVRVGGVGSGGKGGLGGCLRGEGCREQQGTGGGVERQAGAADGKDHVRQPITGQGMRHRGVWRDRG